MKTMVTEVFFQKIRKKVRAAERSSISSYYKCQWEQVNYSGATLFYTVYRTLHLLLIVGVLLLSLLSKEDGLPGRWPIYLTNWALLLYLLQAVLGLRIVLRAYFQSKKGEPIKDSRRLFEVYGALHSTSVVIALGVTFIYWVFVYDPEIHKMDFVNISVHALNSTIMLIDLAFASHPVKLICIIYPPLFTLVYTVFNLIYILCGGTDRKGNHYVYKVIEWETPLNTAFFILGGIFLLVILHIFIWFMTILRRHIGIRLKLAADNVIPQQDTPFELPLA